MLQHPQVYLVYISSCSVVIWSLLKGHLTVLGIQLPLIGRPFPRVDICRHDAQRGSVRKASVGRTCTPGQHSYKIVVTHWKKDFFCFSFFFFLFFCFARTADVFSSTWYFSVWIRAWIETPVLPTWLSVVPALSSLVTIEELSNLSPILLRKNNEQWTEIGLAGVWRSCLSDVTNNLCPVAPHL